MRNLITKKLLLPGIAACMVFTSCSRQIASTKTVEKMMYSESLPDSRVQPVAKSVHARPLESYPLSISTETATTSRVAQNEKPNAALKMNNKDKPKKLVQAFKQEVSRELQKQTDFIQTIYKNPSAASYSGSQHTQGMLGLAAIFLIAAIALAVFGVANMGVVFWEIAAVLFIAAIVFFVFYLIAKAAGPDTP